MILATLEALANELEDAALRASKQAAELRAVIRAHRAKEAAVTVTQWQGDRAPRATS